MKIKYNSLEDSSDLVSQKRSNGSLICQERKKKRKVHKPEVHVVELKENVDKYDGVKVSERDEGQQKFLNSELRRVSRNEEIMTNFAKAFWTVLKQYKHKLLESVNTAESMKDLMRDKDIQIMELKREFEESVNTAESMRELIRDKDIQIMELKRELEVLNSSCSCKNFPIMKDTPGVQDDTMPCGDAAPTLVSQSNQADLSNAATDNLHLAVETEEFTCQVPKSLPTYCELKGEFATDGSSAISSKCQQEQRSNMLEAISASDDTSAISPKSFPTYCELKGESVMGDSSSISSIREQEQSSGDFKPGKSCNPGASGPNFDTESGNTEAEVKVIHDDLASSGISSEETSSLSSTTAACIHSDNQSDQGLAGHHTIACQRTERINESPQFTSYNNKSTTEQIEDESAELSITTVDVIQQDIIKDTMHPGCANSSQQVKFHAEDASSIQSFLELQGMKKAEEVDIEVKRCEPALAVEDSTLNNGCSGRPERSCQAKGPVIVKDSKTEEVADPSVLKPDDPKRKTSRRRLQPVASMMLKEFSSGIMYDLDTRREDRSNKAYSGRSEVLIDLLKKGHLGRRGRA